ncbi:MAG: inorganic diphosphatase [Planctomycetota bacterium]
MRPSQLLPLLFLSVSLVACCERHKEAVVVAPTGDEMFLEHDKSFLADYAPLYRNGDVNVVVEIPAGTVAKWEVTKPEGELRWEIKDGKPRKVQYLGYPANYGMIPCTLLPKELGGDGDPLDVVVLGDALPRGTVVRARIVGVMRMLDGGEQDDKLIAVRPETAFADVHSMPELREHFTGIEEILKAWFSGYKGPGKIQVTGFSDSEEARKILGAAIDAYASEHKYAD